MHAYQSSEKAFFESIVGVSDAHTHYAHVTHFTLRSGGDAARGWPDGRTDETGLTRDPYR